MEMVQVQLRRDVFEKLQKLAVPLVDDISAVIARELDRAAMLQGNLPNATVPTTATWRSARGERFPVGAQLRAHYLHKEYSAKVTPRGIEFDGKVFDNPSSAAIAVKHSAGKTGDAASANGWGFWEMLDPQTNQWVSIDTLRAKKWV
jgi:hypothetical protein